MVNTSRRFYHLWAAAVVDPFSFIYENTRPRDTRAVNEYFETESINRLGWPAVSPEINPIDHA